MPKCAYAANLTLRFYEKDGWEKKELDSYCSKGEVEMPHPNDEDRYFVLKIGSRFDTLKLAPNVEIVKCFSEQHQYSNEQLIEQLNW